MPEVSLYNKKAEEIGKVALSDALFAIEPSVAAMHMVVKGHLANLRQGTQSALTRSEVRGGGRKIYRQKGTGNARHHSMRAPQFRHGGVVFAPKPRSYSFSINKKLKRLALKSALSSKVLENELVVIDTFDMSDVKTKSMLDTLRNFNAASDTLIVTGEDDRNVVLSARNLPGVKTTSASSLNVYDIIKYSKFIVTKEAAQIIEEVYA